MTNISQNTKNIRGAKKAEPGTLFGSADIMTAVRHFAAETDTRLKSSGKDPRPVVVASACQPRRLSIRRELAASAATAPAQMMTLIGRGVPSANQPTAALVSAPAPN